MPTSVCFVCALMAWADPPVDAPLSPSAVVAALESSLADVIERAEASVVAIAREKSDSGKTTAVRGRNPEPSNSDPRIVLPPGLGELSPVFISFDYGSGVVIGAKGEILTAFHVVRGARRLVVRAVGNQSFEAEVIAADPRSDLAVIVPREVPDVAAPKLRPIPLGDATGLRRGSFLVALGNAFNAAAQDGRPSAGWGILANTARKLELPAEEGGPPLRYHPTLLQLDAKLNLGMSGGAVVNMKGELVGVTTAAASVGGFDAQAGYAIPLDAIGRRAIESLREGKEVEYGFLGINLDVRHGSSLVISARPGTPAAEGGIQAGDVVVAVNGRSVNNSDALLLAINALPAGAVTKIKVNRDGEILEKTVELAKYPTWPTSEVIATNVPPPWRGMRVDYTSKDPNAMGQLGDAILDAMSRGGVVVVDVEPDSPADKAGIKPRQIITQVGAAHVRNPRDFAHAVAGLKGPVMLQTHLGEVTIP